MKRFVGVLLVTAVMAVGATPAWAEAPPGDDRVLAVDTQPGYQAQNSCSPSPKPGAVALLDLLIQRWGGSSWGISRGCEVGGRSEHKEGRAFDWHMDAADPGDRARVAEALAWLTADDGEVARRLGVMYIIWDQKVWASYRRGQGWRPMADRGSYTANHHDHVHISLTWDGAMQQTSWWTGVPVTAPLSGPCGLDGVRACLPPTGQALHGLLPGSTPEPIPPESLPEPADHPLVGGLPRVGHLLQVVPGTWVPDGAELAFQWIRDGIPVPDANAATYAVTPLDLGSVLLVRVIAYAPDGSVALQLSDELPAVAPGTFQTAPTPTILGSPVVGGVLSVSPGAWQPFPARMTFRWLHDGDPIPGATGYSYTPTAAEAGRRISVEVTASAPGYESTTVTSAASAPVRTAVLSAPAPVVKGEYLVDRTLTAVPGTWSPTPTALAYQWFRDGKPVAGATKSSFTLTAADLGTEIQVRLRGSRPGYATKSVMSSAHEVRQAPPAAEPPDTSPTPSLPPSSPPSEPAEPTPDPTPTEPTPDPTPSEAPEPTPAEPAPPEPSEATPAPADEDPPQAEPEPETAPTRAAERTPAPTPAPTPEPPPAEPPEPEPTGAP